MSNKKEMNLITQIKFAEQIGISRQGISKALKNGLLPYVEQGNKKMIDLNNPSVKSYVKNSPGQREVYKNTPEIKQTKQPKIVNTSEDGLVSMHDIVQRDKIAQMKLREAKAAAAEKILLPTVFIEDGLFRFIERLASNIERSSSVYIQEVGAQILNTGEILPEHIETFVNAMLKLTHDTKRKIEKEIKEFEPDV